MKQKRPKNVNGITDETHLRRFSNVRDVLNNCISNVDKLHVYIADGNTKTGDIPSVSLIPIFDCGNCSKCSKLCYDWRNDMCYEGCAKQRCVNSAIYSRDPERYFREIRNFLDTIRPREFRWHIGGDIKDANYFANMMKLAIDFDKTRFLCFTKMFDIVNSFVDEHGYDAVPHNLRIIFSAWEGLDVDNHHNFPMSHPIFNHGTTAPNGTLLCTGNCTVCANKDELCWVLLRGEHVGFYCH